MLPVLVVGMAGCGEPSEREASPLDPAASAPSRAAEMSEYAKLWRSAPEPENQRRSDAFETYARSLDREAAWSAERAVTRFVELHRGAGPRDEQQLRDDLRTLDWVIETPFADAAFELSSDESYVVAACSVAGHCASGRPSASAAAWLQGWKDRFVTWRYAGEPVFDVLVRPVVDDEALVHRLRPSLTPGAVAFVQARALETEGLSAVNAGDVEPDALVPALIALDGLARTGGPVFDSYGFGHLEATTRVYLSACAPDVEGRFALPPQCRTSYEGFVAAHPTALMTPAVARFVEVMQRENFRATRREVIDAAKASVRQIAQRPEAGTEPTSPR